MQNKTSPKITTGAILCSAGILTCIYYMSVLFSNSGQKQGQQSASSCDGTVYIVYKDRKGVFQDKLVALGAPSEILSYAFVAYIGAHSIGRTGENLVNGLHSAKGGFIYEIPNPMIRIQLFKAGLVDTIIVPKKLFHSELTESEAQNFVRLSAESNSDKVSLRYIAGKDKRTNKSFSVAATSIRNYMTQYFDSQTSRNAVCS
jgi:hypothetical protein